VAGIGYVILKIGEFQFYASLASKYAFAFLLENCWNKMKKISNPEFARNKPSSVKIGSAVLQIYFRTPAKLCMVTKTTRG